jgi:hypothetical protein
MFGPSICSILPLLNRLLVDARVNEVFAYHRDREKICKRCRMCLANDQRQRGSLALLRLWLTPSCGVLFTWLLVGSVPG